MNETDFPGPYQVADAASISARRKHRRLVAVSLSVAVAAAGFDSVSTLSDSKLETSIPITIAVGLLSVGVVVLLVARDRRYEESWFDGRAVAEGSVRSRTTDGVAQGFEATETLYAAAAFEISERQRIRKSRRCSASET